MATKERTSRSLGLGERRPMGAKQRWFQRPTNRFLLARRQSVHLDRKQQQQQYYYCQQRLPLRPSQRLQNRRLASQLVRRRERPRRFRRQQPSERVERKRRRRVDADSVKVIANVSSMLRRFIFLIT